MTSWANVIAAAGKSQYTLGALALLVLYSLASSFFKKERAAIKLLGFGSLLALVALGIVGRSIKNLPASFELNTGSTTVTGNDNAAATGQNNCVEVKK